MKTKNPIQNFFEELSTTISALGIAKTTNIIKSARTKTHVYDEDVAYLLQVIAEQMNISTFDILKDKGKSQTDRKAYSMLIFMCKEELKYSFGEMALMFNDCKSGTHNYYMKFVEMTSKENGSMIPIKLKVQQLLKKKVLLKKKSL